jgi:hypothetical protein
MHGRRPLDRDAVEGDDDLPWAVPRRGRVAHALVKAKPVFAARRQPAAIDAVQRLLGLQGTTGAAELPAALEDPAGADAAEVLGEPPASVARRRPLARVAASMVEMRWRARHANNHAERGADTGHHVQAIVGGLLDQPERAQKIAPAHAGCPPGIRRLSPHPPNQSFGVAERRLRDAGSASGAAAGEEPSSPTGATAPAELEPFCAPRSSTPIRPPSWTKPTPAASRAARIAARWLRRGVRRPASKSRTVLFPTRAAPASRSCVQARSALAARTWAGSRTASSVSCMSCRHPFSSGDMG